MEKHSGQHGLLLQITQVERDEQKHENKRLLKQVTDLQEKIGELTQTVKELEENKETLSKNVEDLQTTEAQLRKTVIEEQNDNQNLKRKVEELQSQKHYQNVTLQNLEEENQALSLQNHEYEKASKQTESDLLTANQSIADLQTENIRLTQQLESVKECAREADKTVDTQYTRLQRRFELSNNELNDNSRDIADLNNLLNETRAAVTQKTIQNEKLLTHINILERELALKVDENESLLRRQQSFIKQVNDLKEENQKWATSAEIAALPNNEVANVLHQKDLFWTDKLASEQLVTSWQKKVLDDKDVNIEKLQQELTKAAQKFYELEMTTKDQEQRIEDLRLQRNIFRDKAVKYKRDLVNGKVQHKKEILGKNEKIRQSDAALDDLKAEGSKYQANLIKTIMKLQEKKSEIEVNFFQLSADLLKSKKILEAKLERNEEELRATRKRNNYHCMQEDSADLQPHHLQNELRKKYSRRSAKQNTY